MKRYYPFIIVIGVEMLAVGSGIFFYRAKSSANPTPKISKTETALSGESIHALGPKDAPVTLEEFGDFQCPPCGKLSEPINQLQKKYNLRVIFRQFPLPMHANAKEAAFASEAAARQGRFWQMPDLLYRDQAVWGNSTDAGVVVDGYGGMLQLDLGRVRKEMDSAEVQRQVEIDQQRGADIGVKTTPTIFLNDEVVPPKQINPDELPAMVEAAMKKAKP